MKKLALVILLVGVFLVNINIKASAYSMPFDVVAEGALLLDTNSGQIIYEKNKDKIFYPASTTKIMTALLALENCKLDDKVLVGKEPPYIEGSKIFLFEDEVLTVEQLLYALLLESANDAALALAEHISGSEKAFANLMTNRARELGAFNTNFTNPHGLFDENHYTTAYDLSLIAREAMKNETFRKIITTKSFFMDPTNKQMERRPLSTNNKLMISTKYRVQGANGIKTGYTTESGHSFVGSAYRDDTHLMVVLLKDKKPGLWEDAKKLLDYGFDNYITKKMISAGDVVENLEVKKSENSIPLTAKEDLFITYPRNEESKIVKNIVLQQIPLGHIVKEQKLGYVEYLLGDDSIASVDLVAADDVPASLLHEYDNGEKSILRRLYSNWALLPTVGLLTFGAFTGLKNIKRKQRKIG